MANRPCLRGDARASQSRPVAIASAARRAFDRRRTADRPNDRLPACLPVYNRPQVALCPCMRSDCRQIGRISVILPHIILPPPSPDTRHDNKASHLGTRRQTGRRTPQPPHHPHSIQPTTLNPIRCHRAESIDRRVGKRTSKQSLQVQRQDLICRVNKTKESEVRSAQVGDVEPQRRETRPTETKLSAGCEARATQAGPILASPLHPASRQRTTIENRRHASARTIAVS